MVTSLYAQAASHRVLVYGDRNGNGQRDGGEPGLAGVKLIINERAVVLSGADGTARLPVQGADRIAVVKPPGYGLPRRDNRSEGRSGGKECDRTCRSRWSPCHSKKKK